MYFEYSKYVKPPEVAVFLYLLLEFSSSKYLNNKHYILGV